VRLLDTDICIRLMKGDPVVLARIQEHKPSALGFSIVTLFELQVGIEKSQALLFEKKKNLLSRMRDLISSCAFGEREALESAKIRAELESKGKMIGPYDLLIAATARANGWTMVTGNTREFSRVENLVTEEWSS
jgi:tRNA(fMet)-specific endonuclease VapC